MRTERSLRNKEIKLPNRSSSICFLILFWRFGFVCTFLGLIVFRFVKGDFEDCGNDDWSCGFRTWLIGGMGGSRTDVVVLKLRIMLLDGVIANGTVITFSTILLKRACLRFSNRCPWWVAHFASIYIFLICIVFARGGGVHLVVETVTVCKTANFPIQTRTTQNFLSIHGRWRVCFPDLAEKTAA